MPFDIGTARALVSEINFSTLGFDVTVTLEGEEPVDGRGIWMRPDTELQPAGADYQVVSVKRVLAIRSNVIPRIPTGTRITAPITVGGATAYWVTDGMSQVEEDHQRVVVMPDTSRP